MGLGAKIFRTPRGGGQQSKKLQFETCSKREVVFYRQKIALSLS